EDRSDSGHPHHAMRGAAVRLLATPGDHGPAITRPGGRGGSGGAAAAQLAALALAQPAPDAEALVVLQRVFEALAAHRASAADALRVARRAALLGEERLGVRLRAQRVGLPGERVLLVVGDGGAHARHAEANGIDEPIFGDRGAIFIAHVFRPPLATPAVTFLLITLVSFPGVKSQNRSRAPLGRVA